MQRKRSQIIMSPQDGKAFFHRMVSREQFPNGKVDFYLQQQAFLHNSPLSLNEAWNEFENTRSLMRAPVYMRYTHKAGTVERLADVVHYLPSVHKALNNSRRMRRIGVTGARICNVFARGSSFFYVSDTIFDAPYSCAVVAFSLANLVMRDKFISHITVSVKRPLRCGRFVEQELVGKFMRDLKEKARYLRGNMNIDPMGMGDVRIAHEDGLTVGLLLLLLEEMTAHISTIYIGTNISISFDRLVEESDYLETLAAGFRCFKFKYFSTFGDLYKV